MLRRVIGGVMTAALAVVGLAGSAQATTVPLSRSIPPPRVINLQQAYLRALPHVKLDPKAGVVYARGKQPAATGRSTTSGCAEPNCPLVYHGGPVQHAPRIYLLLWGPNWQADSTQQQSYYYLANFYSGLGVTPQDSWSSVTSQYGDNSGSPAFGGSVYMGAWLDTSTPPYGATQTQIAARADAFASQLGITDPTNTQIVVATQSGTCPQKFADPNCGTLSGNECAYHSYSNETYTSLPYMPDAGMACGASTVSGANDGFSIVGGHEYAETITDPQPSTGWRDMPDTGSGGEIGDKCQWKDPVTNVNDSAMVTLSTGSFPMQPLFSNQALSATGDGCVLSSHDTLTLTNPGNQTTTAGTPVSLQVHASSNFGATIYYGSTSLPAGMSINYSTGVISGTPTTSGTITANVEVSDSTGAYSSASFTWAVNQPDSLSLTNPGSQTSTVGTPVSLQVSAASSTGATIYYGSTSLPAGLSIDGSTGLISGTPTTSGTITANVEVSDSAGSYNSATFTWTVNAPDSVSITSPGNQTTTSGKPVSLQIQASSSTGATLAYRAAGLPVGLTINPSTGLITGTPTTNGTSSATVTVTDSTGGTATTSFTWTVAKPPGGHIKGYKGVCVDGHSSKVVIWACNTSASELWSLGSRHSLHLSGKCLTDPHRGRAGTGLVLAPCTGSTAQQWTHKANGEWVLTLGHVCLTDPHKATKNGTQLIIAVCRDTAIQRWTKP